MRKNFHTIKRAKQSQKKFNSIAGTSAFILCFALVLVLGKLYLTYGKTIETSAIVEQGIVINADKQGVEIQGTTVNSAQAFVGYKYKVKKDNLYLQLRYTLATNKNRSGDFKITINDDLSKVKRIYLQGKSKKDLKLLWER